MKNRLPPPLRNSGYIIQEVPSAKGFFYINKKKNDAGFMPYKTFKQRQELKNAIAKKKRK